MTKLQEKIAKYNSKGIWLSRIERDIIIGFLTLSIVYLAIHTVIYLIRTW